ncbi:hypothetical protein EJD97_007286 [Solanum chilense]|uniref:Uncharacterized protein n=1 Tax=Solanum chilense TaxID=4083 RepID=A0A6N2BU91_SOLCI|nr:hypothetical protein EJD97_007286 [Solanum chilense]
MFMRVSIDNVIGNTHPYEILINETTKIVILSFICNEIVEIFNVSRDKAKEILKFADKSKVVYDTSSKIPIGVETQSHGKEKFSIASRNSQLRFLEKRKESSTFGLEKHYALILGEGKREANDILKFDERSKIKNDFSSNYGGNTTSLDDFIDKIYYWQGASPCVDYRKSRKQGNTTSLDDSIDKAVNILAFVESSKFSDACPSGKNVCVETLSGDLPLGRSISLTRFSKKPNTRIYCGSENGINIIPMTFFYEENTIKSMTLLISSTFGLENLYSCILGEGKREANDILKFAKSNVFFIARRFSEKPKTRKPSLDESIDKAINILAFVENSKFSDACPSGKKVCVETLSGDQHLIRRNSMLGFSQKQKER